MSVEESGFVIFRCPTCGFRSRIELVDWFDNPGRITVRRGVGGWIVRMDGDITHDCRSFGGGGASGDREPRVPLPPHLRDEVEADQGG